MSFNTLPVELEVMIVELGCSSLIKEENAISRERLLQVYICVQVCGLWRQILRPHLKQVKIVFERLAEEYDSEEEREKDSALARVASKCGYHSVIRWLVSLRSALGSPTPDSYYTCVGQESCARAAKKGRFETLKLLVNEMGCSFDHRVAAYAGRCGYDHIVKWVAKKNRVNEKYGGKQWDGGVIIPYVARGDLEMVKNLLCWNAEAFFDGAYSTAAAYGQTHMIEYLNTKYPVNERERRKKRRKKRCNGRGRACNRGLWARFLQGHIIRESKTHNLCEVAARNGQLNCVEWLENNNLAVVDIGVFRQAVRGGHIQILDWWREKFIWTIPTDLAIDVIAAITHHQLASLQWLHDKYSVIINFAECYKTAALVGDQRIFMWLLDVERESDLGQLRADYFNCPGHYPRVDGRVLIPESTSQAVSFNFLGMEPKFNAKLALRANVEMFKWLVEMGAPCVCVITPFVGRVGGVELIKWMRNASKPGGQIFEWSTTFVQDAILEGGLYDCVEWAITEGGCTFDPAKLCSRVVETSDVEAAKWIIKKKFEWAVPHLGKLGKVHRCW
jgi:hypothetical protein